MPVEIFYTSRFLFTQLTQDVQHICKLPDLTFLISVFNCITSRRQIYGLNFFSFFRFNMKYDHSYLILYDKLLYDQILSVSFPSADLD